MIISRYHRYCLDLQGYSHLADEAKRRIDLSQRFKPAVCTALVVLALLTRSVSFTIFLALLGYWTAFFPLHHPIDLAYRWVVMPLFNAPDLGMDPAPRRFACGMAATLLLIGGLAWQLGATPVGTALIGMVVLAMLTLVIADFCIGSFFLLALGAEAILSRALIHPESRDPSLEYCQSRSDVLTLAKRMATW